MSFVYNQNDIFHGCSTKSVDFMLANKLATFYLNNTNPNRQDIEQFCKEADFDFNSAVSYIKERKMQDIRNRNLVFMKFGREYIQPSNDQVKEYESSLTQDQLDFSTSENQTNFSKLISSQNKSEINIDNNDDLLLDEIPKKSQSLLKPRDSQSNEKQIQSDIKTISEINSENAVKASKKTSPISKKTELDSKTSFNNKSYKSHSASNDKLEEDSQSSSSSLGRLFNNYYQHSFLPNGITDTKLIHSLILFMKKELKLEQKHEISITLARTSNNLVLQRFLEFEGAEILSNWFHQIKEKIQDLHSNSNHGSSSSRNYLNNILLNLLIFSEKLKISLKDLKFSKIGKEVNKIAKLNLDNKEIHQKCVALVNKWKKIVEETKEGKKPESGQVANSTNKDADLSQQNFDKEKKTDFNQSLLKGILNDEAGKNIEDAARSFDKEQDRNALELLNRKKHHPDRDVKERDRDREYSNISAHAHDKNNKKLKRDESSIEQENLKRKEKDIQAQQLKNAYLSNNKLDAINNKNFPSNQTVPNSLVYTNTIPLGTSIQNAMPAANARKKGPLKGILKNSQQTNQSAGGLKKEIKKPTNLEKKRIKFEHDMELEKVKVFKLTDEPNAPNITEEEYQKIQQDILKDPTRSYLGDMKFRESHMEKENLIRQKEKEKIAKEMFEKMAPEIKITKPLEIYIENPYEEGEEIEKELVSEEKEQIDQFLNKILMTTYFRESDIPPTPKMGKSEMFEFFDENIPKIENLKKSFDSEKPIYEVDFSKIENIESNPDLLKSLAERINNAELNIQSEEEKNKLLAILQNQMKKTEESSKVFNNNVIAPLLNAIPNLLPNKNNPLNPLAATNMHNIRINQNNSVNNPIPHSMPNQMFPPIQPIGMNAMPIVPPFNQMNNMINPINNMNPMNNMNLMKNNMNFPNNNPNFNMPNNPMMRTNMPNNINMQNNFGSNRNPNNIMNGPGNRMNLVNNNFNNPNFGNDYRKNINNQDNRTINFNRIKTKPCRNYHGPVGCPRGDDCYFIHDPENQGQDIPETRLAEIAQRNTENPNNNQINNFSNNNINNNNNNNSNQNNSFYNNNVQNNRFRSYRNFNNRNNNNFSNNRFQNNQQGNFSNADGNRSNSANEEKWNNNNNNSNNSINDSNLNTNVNESNSSENQSVVNNSANFNEIDMQIDSKENLESENANNNYDPTVNLINDDNENAMQTDLHKNADQSNYNNYNSNIGNNYNANRSNQNSQFINHNNNNNNISFNRNNGNMHHRNFHQNRPFNNNRLNNFNRNMNHNNNNFNGQPNFNQQQHFYMMQQNKMNTDNMPYNNNQVNNVGMFNNEQNDDHKLEN